MITIDRIKEQCGGQRELGSEYVILITPRNGKGGYWRLGGRHGVIGRVISRGTGWDTVEFKISDVLEWLGNLE